MTTFDAGDLPRSVAVKRSEFQSYTECVCMLAICCMFCVQQHYTRRQQHYTRRADASALAWLNVLMRRFQPLLRDHACRLAKLG